MASESCPVEEGPTAPEFPPDGESPLELKWGVWFSIPEGPAKPRHRGKKLDPSPPKLFGSFDTVKTMWQWMNNVPSPKDLIDGGTLYVFRDGVVPTWEHPANADGGRWLYSIPAADEKIAADAWQFLYLSLVGGTLDPESESEIVGIALARRLKFLRISVWTKHRFQASGIKLIGGKIRATIPPSVALEYQDHGAPFGDYRYVL